MIHPSSLINKYLEMSAEDKTMFDKMYSLIKDKKHRDAWKDIIKIIEGIKNKNEQPR